MYQHFDRNVGQCPATGDIHLRFFGKSRNWNHKRQTLVILPLKLIKKVKFISNWGAVKNNIFNLKYTRFLDRVLCCCTKFDACSVGMVSEALGVLVAVVVQGQLVAKYRKSGDCGAGGKVDPENIEKEVCYC